MDNSDKLILGLSKATFWTSVGTIAIALGTIVIAVSNFYSLRVMSSQLNVMKEETKIAQMPFIKLHIADNPEKPSSVIYEKTDEGGERWIMPYYIFNLGENPAFKLRYYSKLTTHEYIKDIKESDFQTIHLHKDIWPGDINQCGDDRELRQKAMDIFKAGHKLYRHFYIMYEDLSGNKYMRKAKWALSTYEEFKSLDFTMLENRRITKLNQ